jgi:hypothetical protein
MNSEHVQNSLAPDSFGSGPAPAETETVVDRLMRRVQVLEEDKSWWKRLAIIACLLLLLAVIGGSAGIVGGGVMYWSAMERQREELRMMEESRVQEAQRQAELARQQAELAQQQADLARAQLAAEVQRQRSKDNK